MCLIPNFSPNVGSWHRRTFAAVFWGVLLLTGAASADEIRATDPLPPAKFALPDAEAGPQPERQISAEILPGKSADASAVKRDKQREWATIGLLAVTGIAILGFMLIAVAMMGAGIVRRIVRRPSPQQNSPVNDYWYLKPAASPADHSAKNAPPAESGDLSAEI